MSTQRLMTFPPPPWLATKWWTADRAILSNPEPIQSSAFANADRVTPLALRNAALT